MTSGGSSITFSNASAPSEAITTSQKRSRDFEMRSRISGLSSARRSLTDLLAVDVIYGPLAVFRWRSAGNRRFFHPSVADAGGARGDGFGGDVDDADLAASGVVREFWHFDLGGDFLRRKSGGRATALQIRLRRGAAERKLSLPRECPGGQPEPR